jgi:hypothetical protein
MSHPCEGSIPKENDKLLPAVSGTPRLLDQSKIDGSISVLPRSRDHALLLAAVSATA